VLGVFTKFETNLRGAEKLGQQPSQQTGVSVPTKPEMRGFYLGDWPQISRRVRFERAVRICQGCGRPHGTTVRCPPDGRWFDLRSLCQRCHMIHDPPHHLA
jgi:hypothetical protein